MKAYEFVSRPDRYTIPRAVHADSELRAHIDHLRDQTRHVLCRAPKIVADEVWDAHPALRDAFSSAVGADDVVRLAADHAVRARPPYTDVWIEARSPSFDDRPHQAPWVGCGWGLHTSAESPASASKRALRDVGLPAHAEFGYMVGGTVWVFWREGFTPVSLVHYLLNADGTPLRGPSGCVAYSVLPLSPKGTTSDDSRSMWTLGVQTIAHAISTFGFLGCANVEVVAGGRIDEAVPRKRRGVTVPDMIYRVLRVRRPDKRLVRLDGSDPAGGASDRPMHSVRGHFKRYDGRDGRGLFLGKYDRTVWCPPHVRGNRSAGVVVKDYEIAS